MTEYGFIPTLEDSLKHLDVTRNALAVEAKVRPATINELVSGNAKQISFKTLKEILVTLNRIAEEKGSQKRFNVEDVFLMNNKDMN
ncbi:XRE family transcriptional regulator [Fictibacillus sp. 5RED26]|nr:XRE family transcriptional regulator [Fictibacillus sp. 5RED26]MBH0156010.1 XRE family transcriptional regulator [Fictibacillus sp. 5RED26]